MSQKLQIIKRFDVTQTWHPGWKRNIEDITECVIHGTGGGKTATGLLSWMIGGERSKQYKKGIALFHFLIDRKRIIYQLSPIDRWYYHSSSGKHDKKTIGIELLNPAPGNEGDYTEGQYSSLEDLLFGSLFACRSITRIVGHDYNYNTYLGKRKGCPGKYFSWTRIRDMFRLRHIDLLPEVFEDMIEFEPLTWKEGKQGIG